MRICCPGFFDLIHPGHERFLTNLASEHRDLQVIILAEANHRLRGVRLSPKEAKQRIDVILKPFPEVSIEVVSVADITQWIRNNKDISEIVFGDEQTLESYKWLGAVEQILVKRGGGVRIYKESAFGPRSIKTKLSAFPKSYDAVNSYRSVLDSEGVTIDSLCDKIESGRLSLRALVIGDLIVDEYIHCSISGMSAEAPIPVMQENRRSIFVGGAGVIARHLRSLGFPTTYAGSLGGTAVSKEVESQLTSDDIQCVRLSSDGNPLIKTRYVVNSTKVFRVTRGDEHIPFDSDKINKLLAELNGFNVLFVSDFGSLFRNEPMISQLLRKCEALGIPVVADVQARETGVSILNAPGSYVVMPTEKEARLAVQLRDVGLEELGRTLMAKGGFNSLGLTLDEDGLLLFNREQEASVTYLPALNRDPVDVSGAGDCQLAYFAMSRLVGNSAIASAVLSSIAAGVAVSNLGNLAVSLEEVRACLE